jgi:hypothetical protein
MQLMVILKMQWWTVMKLIYLHCLNLVLRFSIVPEVATALEGLPEEISD